MPNTRPLPSVPNRERRFVPRVVADVHGRRRDVALATPHPRLLELAQWLTPSFYIDFGRPCNSACLYCAVPPHEDAQGFLPLTEVGSIIAAGAQVHCDRAILIGGEPTIYPHLGEVLAQLADAGLHDHIVMTNGLRLADPAFVDLLYRGGVRTVHLSIDTLDSAVYDQLSRSVGRLPKQLEALHNVLGHGGLNLYLYTATTALNAHGLPQLMTGIAAAAAQHNVAPPPVILAVVKPLGDAKRHAAQLLLDPVEAAQLVRNAVQAGDQAGVTVGHRNLQACLAPDLIDRNVDYYLDDFSVAVATGKREPFSHGEYWFKPAGCDGCGHRELCTGLYRDTTAQFGTQAYRPIGHQGLAGE